MEFEQQLRAAFAPRDPRPELRSRILTRASIQEGAKGKGGRANRTIVVGAILAFAAAAAMVAWSLRDESASQPVVIAITPSTAGPTPASEVPQNAEPSAPRTKETTMASDPQEIPPAPSPIHILMLPLQDDISDPVARTAINTFQSELAETLRAIPGLVLLSDLKQAEGLPSYFRITVRQLGETRDGITWIDLEGGEEIPGKRRRNGVALSGLPIDLASTCVPVPEGQMSPCPKGLASYVSGYLRKRLFPPDPGQLLQLQNQALNASLESPRRLEALTELAETKGGGALREAAMVRAAINLISTSADPTLKAQVWKLMKGIRHPDLIAPLAATMRNEFDGEVRLQAVTRLQEDFASDPAAREVLESVAREDSRPLVRAVAQRALGGEADWNQYVLTSVKDASKTDMERIEVFTYFVSQPCSMAGASGCFSSSGQLFRSRQSVDDEAMQALAGLAGRSSEFRQTLLNVVNELREIDRPAMTSLLLTLLDGATTGEKHQLITGLSSQHTDPRSRAALEKIAVEDPDSQLRELAAKALRDSSSNN